MYGTAAKHGFPVWPRDLPGVFGQTRTLSCLQNRDYNQNTDILSTVSAEICLMKNSEMWSSVPVLPWD